MVALYCFCPCGIFLPKIILAGKCLYINKFFHFKAIKSFFLIFKGAQTILLCATEENLQAKSGDFFRNCKIYQSTVKFDVELQKKLWEKSEKLVS